MANSNPLSSLTSDQRRAVMVAVNSFNPDQMAAAADSINIYALPARLIRDCLRMAAHADPAGKFADALAAYEAAAPSPIEQIARQIESAGGKVKRVAPVRLDAADLKGLPAVEDPIAAAGLEPLAFDQPGLF